MTDSRNTLVVCTAGQQRSPTAARLLEEKFDIPAQAAGIHPQARRSVDQEMINWSDYIIAMDEETDGHKTYLQENFNLGNTPITVLGIPDRYRKDDPELVAILEDKLNDFIVRNSNG